MTVINRWQSLRKLFTQLPLPRPSRQVQFSSVWTFIFAHSYSKNYHELSWTCYDKLTPQAPLNSSVLRRLQKQECDEDRRWTAAESEFQAGPETAMLHDPYRDSQQHGILRSRREHDRRRDRPVVIDTGMHMSVRYDGALQRRHLLISVHSLNRMHCRNGSQCSSSSEYTRHVCSHSLK